jgi:hypothetical protein
VFVIALSLLFAGCDILTKLGIDTGGNEGEPEKEADVPVAFTCITVGESGATTTGISLVFDREIPGLSAGDITLDAGETGATAADLLGDGTGTYTLALSGVETEGEITVGVRRSGYSFSPASQAARVYYAEPIKNVTFNSADADGAAFATTTTMLTLKFSGEIDGLEAKDITINAGDTGAGKSGHFSRNGATYYIGVSGIKATGEVTVGVRRDGYSVSPASLKVNIHGSKGLPVAGQENNASIKAKFGVPPTVTEKAGVEAAFDALHAFIQAGGLASGLVKTGDWIDLDAGLAVAAYGTGEDKYTGGVSHNATKAMEAVTHKGEPWGTLCRLIVVGINSFNGKNGNDTPHVVFQFQNIPVTRRMNATDTNEGGYEKSEMRKYLVPVTGDSASGNFLTGLNNAGVPDGVLWAPARVLSKGADGKGSVTLSDKLWLPTEREMFGSRKYSTDGETADNQARLEYYTGDNTRLKAWWEDTGSYYPNMRYDAGWWYWGSSCSYSGGSASFCLVHYNGNTNHNGASSAGGVAPAFCVK